MEYDEINNNKGLGIKPKMTNFDIEKQIIKSKVYSSIIVKQMSYFPTN